MKQSYWRLIMSAGVVLGMAVLAGCASEDDDEILAAPLPAFEAKFEPKPLWEKSISTTVGEDIAISADGFWRGLWPWSKPAGKEDRPADADVPADLAPVWYNGQMYVVNAQGLLLALNAQGEVQYRRWLGTRVSGGLTAAAGHLFVGTPEGEVLALKAENGEEVWRNLVSSEVIAPVAVSDGNVVVRSVDGKLFALNFDNGERKWFIDRNVPSLTQRGTSAPIIVSGMVIAGFDNGKVSAFRLADGKELWEKRVAQPTGRSEIDRIADIDADPVVFGSTLYVASFNGSIIAVDLRNGENLWQREISTYRSMGVDAQMLYVATANGFVTAIDRRNGFVVWTQKALENRYLSAPVAFGDYVVVGDQEGYLHFMQRNDGGFVAGISIDDDGFQAAPSVQNDWLVVYDRNDRLSVFGLPTEVAGKTFSPY